MRALDVVTPYWVIALRSWSSSFCVDDGSFPGVNVQLMPKAEIAGLSDLAMPGTFTLGHRRRLASASSCSDEGGHGTLRT